MSLRNILILIAVLGIAAVVFVRTRPEIIPPAPPPKMEYVWLFEMQELTAIVLELPRDGQKMSYAKHEDRQFYFDDPPGPKVDPARWGGGIPLLLSGPAAERPMTRDASDEQLDVFGFTEPLMVVTLTRDAADTVIIEIGDPVPDGHAYYVRVAEALSIYTVDATWYDVLVRLVTEPPYPPEEEDS